MGWLGIPRSGVLEPLAFSAVTCIYSTLLRISLALIFPPNIKQLDICESTWRLRLEMVNMLTFSFIRTQDCYLAI